jgi:hypothetical protein
MTYRPDMHRPVSRQARDLGGIKFRKGDLNMWLWERRGPSPAKSREHFSSLALCRRDARRSALSISGPSWTPAVTP